MPRRGAEVPRRGAEAPRRGAEVPRRGAEVPRRGALVVTAFAEDGIQSDRTLRQAEFVAV